MKRRNFLKFSLVGTLAGPLLGRNKLSAGQAAKKTTWTEPSCGPEKIFLIFPANLVIVVALFLYG